VDLDVRFAATRPPSRVLVGASGEPVGDDDVLQVGQSGGSGGPDENAELVGDLAGRDDDGEAAARVEVGGAGAQVRDGRDVGLRPPGDDQGNRLLPRLVEVLAGAEVDDGGARVGVVVHPDHAQGARGWIGQRPQQSQDRTAPDAHAESLGQSGTGPAGQSQSDPGQSLQQRRGSTRVAGGQPVDLFSEGLGRAAFNPTEEAARPQSDGRALTRDRLISQVPLVTTMNLPRRVTAGRAPGGRRPRADPQTHSRLGRGHLVEVHLEQVWKQNLDPPRSSMDDRLEDSNQDQADTPSHQAIRHSGLFDHGKWARTRTHRQSQKDRDFTRGHRGPMGPDTSMKGGPRKDRERVEIAAVVTCDVGSGCEGCGDRVLQPSLRPGFGPVLARGPLVRSARGSVLMEGLVRSRKMGQNQSWVGVDRRRNRLTGGAWWAPGDVTPNPQIERVSHGVGCRRQTDLTRWVR
jgi:hypothetical protein